MKRIVNIIAISIIVIIFNSCGSMSGWTTRYKSVPVGKCEKFNCSSKNEITKEKILQISPQDIQSCYFKDTTKITWILLVHIDCVKSIEKKMLFFNKYKDNFNLIVISDDYNIETIKEEEQKIAYPIYFIDPSYSNSRTRNTKLFIESLFNKQVGKEFASSIFVFKNEIVNMTWNIDDNTLNEIISLAKSKN
jgi:hypothetical protein